MGAIWVASSFLVFFGFAWAWWSCLAMNAVACVGLLALHILFLFMLLGGHLYLALSLLLSVPASIYLTLSTRPA